LFILKSGARRKENFFCVGEKKDDARKLKMRQIGKMRRIGSRRTRVLGGETSEILTKKRFAAPRFAVAAFQERKEKV
jgi:hypothetical protein